MSKARVSNRIARARLNAGFGAIKKIGRYINTSLARINSWRVLALLQDSPVATYVFRGLMGRLKKTEIMSKCGLDEQSHASAVRRIRLRTLLADFVLGLSDLPECARQRGGVSMRDIIVPKCKDS